MIFVTDPTIGRSECRVSDLWVFGYLNLLSNLLCGRGATMLYFFQPLLLDYKILFQINCSYVFRLSFYFFCPQISY